MEGLQGMEGFDFAGLFQLLGQIFEMIKSFFSAMTQTA